MRPSALFRVALLAGGVAAAIGTGIRPAEADYIQTNLISDIPGLAIITDAALKNPWGISHGPTTPFWVSDQATNLTTLYVVNNAGVSKNAALPQVSIPTTGSGPPEGPTGQVSNIGRSNFLVRVTQVTGGVYVSAIDPRGTPATDAAPVKLIAALKTALGS